MHANLSWIVLRAHVPCNDVLAFSDKEQSHIRHSVADYLNHRIRAIGCNVVCQVLSALLCAEKLVQHGGFRDLVASCVNHEHNATLPPRRISTPHAVLGEILHRALMEDE